MRRSLTGIILRGSKAVAGVAAFFAMSAASVFAAEPLTVNWYHKEQYLQPVIDAFIEETGIEVEVTSDYDTFTTDVMFVSDYKGLLEAKHFHHFRKMDAGFFSDMSAIVPEQWRDEDGYWLGAVLRVRTAVVNNKQVSDGEKPKQLLDLADPKWKGRMTIRSASNVYNRSLLAYMIYRYGEEEATRWAAGIVSNFGDSDEYRGDTGNAKAVADGSFDISFTNTYYLGYLQSRTDTETPEMRKALRDELDVVWLDGGEFGLPVNVTGVGISSRLEDGSEKLSNAEKLVAFTLSKNGQALMSEHVFKYPVRSDVKPSKYLAQFGDFKKDGFNLNDLRFYYDDADRIMKQVGWKALW